MEETESRQTELVVIRTELRKRIAETSLRAAAREIGLSPTGLSLFLEDGMAFGSTMRRARAWYAWRVASQQQDDVAEAFALEVLFGPLSAAAKEFAKAECQELLRRFREEPGRSPTQSRSVQV